MKKLLLYILAIIHFFTFFYCISSLPDFDCCIGILLSFILSFSICLYILSRSKLDLFSPIILYSCFNLFTPMVQLYIVFNHSNNLFLNAQPLIHRFSVLFNITCLMNLLGYYACLFGYKLFSKIENRKRKCIKPSNHYLPLFLFVLESLALINFIYNMRSMGGSIIKNPALLYSAISTKSVGTTIFYNCAIFALYIYMAETEKRNKIIESLLLFIAFILIATNLRIFLSLTIILIYIGIKYEDNSNPQKNKKFVLVIFGLLCAGILFYYFRIIMSLSLMGKKSEFKDFAENFGYFAFDKGNTPNVAIQMFLYDRWNNYLLGKSFLAPLISWLGVDTHNFIPAAIIKRNFFMQVMGGNLPVTGVGEFYMNFSYPGVIWGMFLFGVLGGILYTRFYKSPNRIIRIMGIYFSISFYMLFPKGELNNIGLFQPICILIIYIIFDFIKISSKITIPYKEVLQ